MTQKLKRRFVIFAMTAVTLMLVFVIAAINMLNWMMLEGQSDAMLNILADADGVFHRMYFKKPPLFSRTFDLDRMHSMRFFIVRSDAFGGITEINTDHVSSVDADTAAAYAAMALDTGREAGRVNGYKFLVKAAGGEKLVFFMDVTEQSESFQNVLFVSAAIAVLCWLMLLLIVILLSGKVIRPVLAGMEKQKQFITNAGHEMKTPLAIIQSNNDVMALIHGENKYNVHIRNQTNRLNVLMSNLLVLAKLDEEIPLSKERVNVTEAMEELLPVYMEEAKARGMRFSAMMQPEVFMEVHRDSFRQMLTILLDNASKYTPDAGEICITLSKEGRHVQIVQENTCDPAHEPDPERLFERFYRGDAARTQKKEASGYGIGLSAARAICENSGGRLTAQYIAEDRIRFTAGF